MIRRLRVTFAVLAVLTVFRPAPAFAQKTDVVTLANGDRITGEIERLERGRLEFSTDDAGTLYLEWDKLISLTATSRTFEVVTGDIRRFLGSLGPAVPRALSVIDAGGTTTTLAMADVTYINPIGSSFWSKIDGSFDTGFNYTRSSGISQLNVNSLTAYRRPGFKVSLAASLTVTGTEDSEDKDDRGSLEASYVRYDRRWVVSAAGRFETNESLGIDLRSQGGAAAGPRLVNSNRGQLWMGAGLAVNREDGVDTESTTNLEALFVAQGSFYTYDRPKTTIDVTFQYYPSLSTWGRQRLQLDASLKRELLKDFFLSLNLYDSFDSRPPNTTFDTNDFGIVLSIGWSY